MLQNAHTNWLNAAHASHVLETFQFVCSPLLLLLLVLLLVYMPIIIVVRTDGKLRTALDKSYNCCHTAMPVLARKRARAHTQQLCRYLQIIDFI